MLDAKPAPKMLTWYLIFQDNFMRKICIYLEHMIDHIDGLVQERYNSSALALTHRYVYCEEKFPCHLWVKGPRFNIMCYFHGALNPSCPFDTWGKQGIRNSHLISCHGNLRD